LCNFKKSSRSATIAVCWTELIANVHDVDLTSHSKHGTARGLDDVVNDAIFFSFLSVEVVIPVEIVLHLQTSQSCKKQRVMSSSVMSAAERHFECNIPFLPTCR